MDDLHEPRSDGPSGADGADSFEARRRRVLVAGLVGAALCFGVAGASWAFATDDPANGDVAAGDPGEHSLPGAPTTGAIATTSTSSTTSTTSTTVPTGPLTLVFGGDVHLDGPLATTLQRDPDAIFDGLQPVLSDADVAIVNLETAVTTGGAPQPKEFTFRADPAIFDVMRDAGIDVIAGANNHSIDYGAEGFVDTLRHAEERGAPLIGVGWSEAEAFRPASLEVRGTRIAVVNATDVLDAKFIPSWTAGPDKPGVASAKNTERLLAEVRSARAVHDVVVVYLHWGVEATTCPSARQESLAAHLRDAGADVVVGTHAHRVLGGGMLGDTYVHYGLGNLVFKTSSTEGRRTGLVRVTVEERRVRSVEWLPARIGADFTPSLLEGAQAVSEARVAEERRACTGLDPAPVS